MGKKILQFLIIIAILGVLVQIVRTSIKTYQSKTRAIAVQQNIEGIRLENKELQDLLVQQSNPSYIETIARNKLNLGRENEKLIIVLEEESNGGDKETIASRTVSKEPLDQWLLLLFGDFN